MSGGCVVLSRRTEIRWKSAEGQARPDKAELALAPQTGETTQWLYWLANKSSRGPLLVIQPANCILCIKFKHHPDISQNSVSTSIVEHLSFCTHKHSSILIEMYKHTLINPDENSALNATAYFRAFVRPSERAEKLSSSATDGFTSNSRIRSHHLGHQADVRPSPLPSPNNFAAAQLCRSP